MHFGVSSVVCGGIDVYKVPENLFLSLRGVINMQGKRSRARLCACIVFIQPSGGSRSGPEDILVFTGGLPGT